MNQMAQHLEKELVKVLVLTLAPLSVKQLAIWLGILLATQLDSLLGLELVL